jgi:hypothetical protein
MHDFLPLGRLDMIILILIQRGLYTCLTVMYVRTRVQDGSPIMNHEKKK